MRVSYRSSSTGMAGRMRPRGIVQTRPDSFVAFGGETRVGVSGVRVLEHGLVPFPAQAVLANSLVVFQTQREVLERTVGHAKVGTGSVATKASYSVPHRSRSLAPRAYVELLFPVTEVDCQIWDKHVRRGDGTGT